MSDWKSLPSEILNIIFLYLKKSDKNTNQQNKDLSECSLTCRGWRNVSQVAFFSDINLQAKNDLIKLFCLLLVNINIRRLIKTLNFDGSLEYSTDFAILLALDMHFSNLEGLNFSGDNLLYSSFTNIVTKNGNFKNLKSLPTPKNNEQDQIYLQSINSLKDRITTIELFDDPTAIRNSYSDLRERLNVFPHLEEIVVYTSTRNMFSKDFMRYLEFIANKKLESLKKVSIVSSCNNGYCFQLFTSGQQTLFSTTEPKNIHAIIKSETRAITSIAFIFFMMVRFPNTNSFRLEYDFHTLQHLETPSSIDLMTLIPFLRYLSIMPNFLLQNIVLPNETAFKLIKDFYVASEDKRVSTKLLRRIKIRSKIYYINNYSSSEVASSNSSSISFEKINTREKNVNITLNSSKISSNHYNWYNFSQYQKLPSYEDHFQQLIQQIGCFFEIINFEITTNSRFDTLLNCILNYCTRLTDLVIAGHKSLSEESFLLEKKSKSTCNIKSLTLLGFTPTQRQLINLLDQLPNLETLSLTNLFSNSSNSSQESFFSICLPNASLKCLEINMDDVLDCSDCVIKIVTDDPNQKNVLFSFLAVHHNNHSDTKGYYVGENITEAKYQRGLINPGGFPTYLIYCKSLEKFIIKYTDMYNRQCHKKLDLLLSA